MTKQTIATPAVLLDIDKMENNMKIYQSAADKYNKQLWPMTKTHKSTEIALLQKQYGAQGFLCGTLDECEALIKAGADKIMYAYPVAGEPNISRVIALSKKSDFIIRLDDLNVAQILNDEAKKAGVKIQYTIILDIGLHRFGLEIDTLLDFAMKMKTFNSLIFMGVSTHPGQIYGCRKPEEVPTVVAIEKKLIGDAVKLLRDNGFDLKIVSSGSTPTFMGAVDDTAITVYHPGNYVFLDYIQMSLGAAKEEDCSLSVLATVISHPKEDLFIIDAGAKCLGLDQGAHGNTSIKGYGLVKGHPELVVAGLSEEVGKIHAEGNTSLKVGDRIEIIPNHSCSTANLTSYLLGCRGDKVEHIYKVDIRGNNTDKQ